MGLFDFVKGELLEVIQWDDDSRDTLTCRYPDDDREIKRGAQLIVRESQTVQFVYLGEFADTFGPGKYKLTTDNIPVLTTLKSWKYGFESPFKADIYYVVTRVFAGNRWGTSNPVMMRDRDFGVARVRAFGTYDFKIVDPRLFLREVAGTDQNFKLDEFEETMRSRIVSVFSEALAESNIPVLDVASRYSEIGESLLPQLNAVMKVKYGLEFTSFVLENVSMPKEVEEAMDKRTSMSAIGDMNEFVKFQMAQGFGKGEAGTGGVAAEMALGLAMAQQVIRQQGAATGHTAAIAAPDVADAAPRFDLLDVTEVAQALGVETGDVLAAIEAGDLKARKIGTVYRVTRAALEAFVKGDA